MTIFLGSAADPTFRYTVSALRQRGVEGEIADLGHLVLAGDLHLPLDGTTGSLDLAGRCHELAPPLVARLIDISAAAPDRELAQRARAVQCSLANYLAALPWNQVVGGIQDNSNFSKAYQLSLARGRSWSIPRTCLTNDPDQAARFAAARSVIYKGASSAKTWAREFRPEDTARLPLLRHAPVLFQEQITGYDVRVHVVGDRVFGEAVRAASCDYRTDRAAAFAPVSVPEPIAADCVRLTRAMRLVFSGVDFKVSDAGEWFFLEANSAPCFQGYDRRLGGAISDALADYLLDSTDAAGNVTSMLSRVPSSAGGTRSPR
ncbi:MAG TPA: hypothetical protein VNF47_03630 [Streptosporangiaceae bacterium]|nr:hypothetical protein [Streptosporangiaceae bacterium]